MVPPLAVSVNSVPRDKISVRLLSAFLVAALAWIRLLGVEMVGGSMHSPTSIVRHVDVQSFLLRCSQLLQARRAEL